MDVKSHVEHDGEGYKSLYNVLTSGPSLLTGFTNPSSDSTYTCMEQVRIQGMYPRAYTIL